MTRTSTLARGLLGATALSLFAAPAFAAPNNYTPANTDVNNTFTLSYKTSPTATPVTITNEPGQPGDNGEGVTTFKVDRIINVTVTGGGTTSTAPGATDAALVFSVVNDGNDTHEYLFDLENEGGDQFDVSNESYEYAPLGTAANCGAVAASAYTPYNPSASPTPAVPTVAPDEVLCVRVLADIDASAVNGNTGVVTLKAITADGTTELNPSGTPTNGTTTVESVFTDTAGDFTNDAAGDGDHSDSGTFTIQAAVVTASKSVALITNCGTFPGTAAPASALMVPDACVEYTITVDNSGGAADATVDSLADTLPQYLRLVDAEVANFSTAGTLSVDNSTTESTWAKDCTGANCVVNLANAVVASGQVATLKIHATIK